MLPTYVFVGSLGAVIVVGLLKAWIHGGRPVPVAPILRPEPAVAAVSAWLLMKAFSSGCTAMTGVEAVGNGVQAFRDPKVKNARATLTIIIATLIFLLAGIAYLCRVYNIAATQPGQPGYQSVLSQLTLAVTGRGVFYFITMAAVLTVPALSANTSFADFPRLCRAIAEDQWLPDSRQSQIRLYGSQFELVGDPLVISDDVVLVDAVERKSGESCRVRIPLNIVKVATEQASQTYAA